MGIDTTFQPKTPTYAVDNTAAVTIDGRQNGVTSWRIRAVTAAGYVRWSQGGTTAPAAATAPVIGTPVANEIGVNLGQTVYIEGIGAWIQFIGNAAFATSSVEVTGGQGGCGG
jgi:hypothetical protein